MYWDVKPFRWRSSQIIAGKRQLRCRIRENPTESLGHFNAEYLVSRREYYW